MGKWKGLAPPDMGGIESPVSGRKRGGPLGGQKVKNPIGAYKLGRRSSSKKLRDVFGGR